ncbi:hypothetical protein BDV98DRAFT_514348 [Pterulicium gracile]|uniref:Golgi apparatus membrane protein TVP38 n=1 Tax=Pterulicium gracile TaxID=1884261 RepID=A0A5C3QAD3_9AGAR|nr:hypothetical protein BDV98DRAFT_514348 [Pterula gracilis]
MNSRYSSVHDQQYPPAAHLSNDPEAARNADKMRGISRTPSPTPSEVKELSSGSAVDWKTLNNWRFWIRREWFWYYVIFAVLITLGTLMAFYNEQIVDWLEPAADWMHETPVGWLIPIGITIVLSFPPLLGQEIVGVLCGLVWGLWVGFAIFAGGTLLGEIANFYAFKYCCRSTGEKLERKNITYACLARTVRDGGFRIVLAARLSALPGHFSTAVCSVCGTGIIAFTIATTLSLPRQFVTVYLGVILRDAGEGSSSISTSTIINAVVLVVTFGMTAFAMWYIMNRMNKVKPDVIYARRKARQEKLENSTVRPLGDGATDLQVFHPQPSNPGPDMIPMAHQQWDSQGQAVGYAYDPRLQHMQPQPVALQHPRGSEQHLPHSPSPPPVTRSVPLSVDFGDEQTRTTVQYASPTSYVPSSGYNPPERLAP